jgi:intraflagellar transport protein 172
LGIRLVQRGDWTQALAAAQTQGGQVLNKYVALYAARLVHEGRSSDALALFLQHGAPPNEANFNLCVIQTSFS